MENYMVFQLAIGFNDMLLFLQCYTFSTNEEEEKNMWKKSVVQIQIILNFPHMTSNFVMVVMFTKVLYI
jgi:hypothetical protein